MKQKYSKLAAFLLAIALLFTQFQGMSVKAEDPVDTATALYNLMFNAIENVQEAIDISSLNIPDTNDGYGIVSEAWNKIKDNPAIFYLDTSGPAYTSYLKEGYYKSISVKYTDTAENIAAKKVQLNAAVAEAMANIPQNGTDLEKIIAAHDYIDYIADYDYPDYWAHNANKGGTVYDLFVNKSAICSGFARGFKYLMQLCGIQCMLVDSSVLGHTWDLVKLGDNWYHVDTTWDSPRGDGFYGNAGEVQHDYLLLSDTAIESHRDATTQTHYGWDTLAIPAATDTSYDNAFWYNDKVTSRIINNPLDGKGYYIAECGLPNSYNAGLYSYDFSTGQKTLIKANLADWSPVRAIYTYLSEYNGLLYYNTPISVCRMNFNGSNLYTIRDETSALNTNDTSAIYETDIVGDTLRYFIKDKADIWKVRTEHDYYFVTGISLNKTSDSIIVGNSDTLTTTIAPDNATNKAVTWSSSNTATATVDQSGKVTAVAPGTATITAATIDCLRTASCAVTVNTAPVAVTSVSLDKNTSALNAGAIDTLVATVNPSNATNKAVTWSSSNTSVATVDQSGRVTAVATGTATITVTTADGGKTAVCTITVTQSVTGITLNKTADTLTVGNTETLAATVNPSGATNKAVTWSSSNTAVATVDQSGKVTAIAIGTAVITVTTADGGKSASCTVTVNPAPISVSSVTLNKNTGTLTVGDTETLAATVNPNNATNQTVTWSSSNTAVATVDQSGKVTAVAAGTATITVTTQDGNKTATCAMTVNAAIPVVGITMALQLMVGDSETFSAIVSPENATNQTVIWSSSNPSVVSVDQNGNVTALAPGMAKITATTVNGGYEANYMVKVVMDGTALVDVSLYHGQQWLILETQSILG
ncbi:MAG: Ig-like domain-containing protein, partial [Clostridiales bacterium]|nr:Ig-like domain-containing protein [Clostridiales bacterium]